MEINIGECNGSFLKNIDLNMSPPQDLHSNNFTSSINLSEEYHISSIDLNTNPSGDDNFVPSINLSVSGDNQAATRSGRELTDDMRQAIFQALLKESVKGKLKRGSSAAIALSFSVSIRSVQRIWKRAKESGVDIENQLVNVSNRKPKNCGRKRVELDCNRLREIPLRRRTTLRSLASAMEVPKTTLFRHFKSGNIRRHTNAIKPLLKEENMKSRLRFCILMLDPISLSNNPRFVNMYNIIHIDEKWFYMTKNSEKYYLLPDEEEPLRTCKSKNFITKVMFLVAVARPRFDENGNEEFSGKIGVFPFITKEPAKRNSKNRNAGTLETKTINSINKDISRSFIIEKLLPAIRAKWPRSDSGSPIFIQQDNAKPHIDINDAQFLEAARIDGFDIRLFSQPPNSPDLNILDLGFFSAIQALQHQEAPNSIDDLITAVERSFDAYSTKKLNYVFLTLQSCMIEIMKTHGSNKYHIPHMGKASLERDGRIPVQLEVDPTLVQGVMAQLQ